MPELEERETRIEPRPTPEAEEIYLRWIGNLDDEFARHHKPVIRAEIVRVQLHQLFLSRPSGGKAQFHSDHRAANEYFSALAGFKQHHALCRIQ